MSQLEELAADHEVSVLRPSGAGFDAHVPVLIIGAGGCGLCAGLAARQGGAEVLVVERDKSALGTTAMSTGLIPAAGSRFQREHGIEDSPARFAADIMEKTHGQTDQAIALALAKESARTVEWLADDHDVPLSLVTSFLYPGHSVMRMHGTPNRTGSELMGALMRAAGRADLDVVTEATVTDLFADEAGRIHGARSVRPDGEAEDIGCDALILACCGFAGNPEMIAELIPEIVPAEFYGHPGNKGEAIAWGRELGAALADIRSYQGHGGLAKGYSVPILWPVIIEGGFQVNKAGRRFANEARGYSEQAVDVLAQSDHVAFTIYDARLHELMQEFDDYRDAMDAGAIRTAPDLEGLCELTGVSLEGLRNTMTEVAAMVHGQTNDALGRDFTQKPMLEPPYYAVRVTGALFHTQGGLVVDHAGRVKRPDGSLFPNLWAGGGAARGISGPSCDGYIAGNGLLTATTFGRLAGESAAAVVRG